MNLKNIIHVILSTELLAFNYDKVFSYALHCITVDCEKIHDL